MKPDYSGVMPVKHEPLNYQCPFCRISNGAEAECIVANDLFCYAVISLGQKPGNPVSVLVASHQHYENLYEVPDAPLAATALMAKRVAVAMRQVLGCEGITVAQHNESAGGQDVWHYHVHLHPRHEGDGFAEAKWMNMPLEERARYATRIRAALDS